MPTRCPLFQRFGVEDQLSAMYQPVVQLKSGGYLVINPTEALGVDRHQLGPLDSRAQYRADRPSPPTSRRRMRSPVSSGLRDMAGLVVIDFIDMESNGHIRKVERTMKEALKNDRARIQVGRISSFGLMEMSRQRLRTGVLEASTRPCAHCEGTGLMRTAASAGLSALRMLEEEAARGRGSKICLRAGREAAIYVLNRKRGEIAEVEARYGVQIEVLIDESFEGARMAVESFGPPPIAPPRLEPIAPPVDEDDDFIEEDEEEEIEEEEAEEQPREAREPRGERGGDRDRERERSDEDKGRKRRRRRGRRGGRRREGEEGQDEQRREEGEAPYAGEQTEGSEAAPAAEVPSAEAEPAADAPAEAAADAGAEEDKPKSRRRPRARRKAGDAPEAVTADAAPAEAVAAADAVAPLEEAPVAEAAAEEEVSAKPKRRRRSKKADEAEAAAAAEAAFATAAEEAPAPAAANDPASPEGPVLERVAGDATPSANEAAADAGPPRRGWWQRTFGA
jgi:ribonuclease E